MAQMAPNPHSGEPEQKTPSPALFLAPQNGGFIGVGEGAV